MNKHFSESWGCLIKGSDLVGCEAISKHMMRTKPQESGRGYVTTTSYRDDCPLPGKDYDDRVH